MLKALRGAGGNNLEYLMNEGESVKLRFEIEQLIESNIKVKDELGEKQKKNQYLAKKLLKMQEVADEMANKLRRSKLARESNKDLLPIFSYNQHKGKNKSTPQTQKKDYIETLDAEEKENRHTELQNVLDLTDAQRLSVGYHRSMLEIAELMAPSRQNNPRELYPSYYKNSISYVKEVLKDFLEEDIVLDSSQAYFSFEGYTPIIKSRMLNMKQDNYKDAQIQLQERPKDRVKVNAPILERPLKTQFIKTHN